MRPLIPLFLLAAACPSPAAPAQAGPAEKIQIPDSPLSFEIIPIPGGPARIGDPVRDVTLRAFKMGSREVTWNEFNLYFESKPGPAVDGTATPTRATSYFGQVGVPAHFLEVKRPVTNVRWHAAVGYCHWLSRKTGAYYRLPTEAEWEHAARAGASGTAPANLNDLAWHKDNSDARTHEGAEKKPNAFGLYDMVGNLWEYALEFQKGSEYVPILKGGCWSTPAAESTFTRRQTIPLAWFEEDPNRPRSVWWLTNKDASQGFRLVCAADAADRADREAAAAKVEIRITGSKEKVLKTETSQAFFAEVTGEIRNGGDRALEEVEILVFYLDPKGKPHVADVSGANKPGQATWGKAWPALPNSTHDGAHRAPLKPGETRAFTIDLPQSFDTDEEVDREKFAGRATNVRLAK